MPQNDPFGGWVIWSSLPPEDIGGAEVVRGAGAGPYGAGALTGVVALSEARGTGLVAGDASLVQANGKRLAAAGGTEIGPLTLFASASDEDSDGWIPVSPAQRGPADDAVTYHARNVSLRAEAEPWSGTLVSLRLGAYGENRDSGLVGSQSSADGVTASLTLAHPQSGDDLGWRLQAWLRNSGFSNTSATVLPGRAGTTLSNDQYSTPALGWGFNAALRGTWSWLDWEVGGDARFTQGDSQRALPIRRRRADHEPRQWRAHLRRRASMSRARRIRARACCSPLGVRADQWASTGGHLIQSVLATGAVTVNQNKRLPRAALCRRRGWACGRSSAKAFMCARPLMAASARRASMSSIARSGWATTSPKPIPA